MKQCGAVRVDRVCISFRFQEISIKVTSCDLMSTMRTAVPGSQSGIFPWPAACPMPLSESSGYCPDYFLLVKHACQDPGDEEESQGEGEEQSFGRPRDFKTRPDELP